MRRLKYRIGRLLKRKPHFVCSAGVIVLDENNRVLLQLRTDSNSWGIPGGGMSIGETPEETAKREVYEETGLIVEDLKLFNVYSGEEQHWIYPDGNNVYYVSTVYTSRSFHGNIKADEVESKDVKFFDIDHLPIEIISTNLPVLRDLKDKIKSL